MKILACHNHYQQAGGEDQVFADECALLADRGHTVVRYTVHNDAIHNMSHWNVAWRSLWNPTTAREVSRIIDRERPDVLHCTNAFPLLSPSIYYAARRRGLAVVQSLHNYRLLCCNSLLLRDGQPCESCVGRRVAWPGVQHACYRGSHAGSAVVAAIQTVHRVSGTWSRAIDLFTACTDYSRAKFIAAGLPGERIATRPNFVFPDPNPGDGRGGYAVFVGRLSAEKGVEVLLDAWQHVAPDAALKIIGDGPMRPEVERAVEQLPNVEWLGRKPSAEVMQIVGGARCLVLPSICYENGPKAMLEAYAKGTPVIASRLGAMTENVIEGRTGLLFEPRSGRDLAAQVMRLWRDDALAAGLRRTARAEYEERYSPDVAHENLVSAYQRAIASRDADPRRRQLAARRTKPVEMTASPTASADRRDPLPASQP